MFRVVIEVFAGDENESVIGRVLADEAELLESSRRIVGNGYAQYISEEFRVSGRGFVVDIDSRTLSLKKECVATSNEHEIKSASMTVEYDQQRGIDDFRPDGIQKLTIKDDVEISSKEDGKGGFSSVYADIAVYKGSSGIISFPQGAEVVRDERKISFDHFEIKTHVPELGAADNASFDQ